MYKCAVLTWDEINDTVCPRPPRLYPGRKPSIAIDAGGVGVPISAFHERNVAIEPLVEQFYQKYEYSYNLDELLLDTWFQQCFGKEWWKNKELYVYPTDKASGVLDLGNLELLSPQPVDEDAVRFAHVTCNKYFVHKSYMPHSYALATW